MRRRTHNKSRAGCRECKQKHVKCDETQPACANCVAAKRLCSYLLLSVSKPGQPLTEITPSPEPHTPSNITDSATLSERYTLSHIELVLHYEHALRPAASMGSAFGNSFLSIALQQGLQFPYLMDQIIALSALHKSTTLPQGSSKRELFHAESVKLQTRALARFRDAQANIEPNNALSMFLFSSVLGQQLICDALRYHDDFVGTLDGLVQCCSLYRGIRAIADHSWPTIKSQFEAESGQPYPKPVHTTSDPSSAHTIRIANLQNFFQDQVKDDETRNVYLKVLEALQKTLDKQAACTRDPFLRAEAVHEWVIHVPATYVELLRQRQPEALIILTGFGVLLHNARDCWAFADAGSRIISGIGSYLGVYWAKWLEWPKAVLSP